MTLNRVADLCGSAVAGITFKYVLPVVEAGKVQQVFAQSAGGTKAFEFEGDKMLTAYGKTNGKSRPDRVAPLGYR